MGQLLPEGLDTVLEEGLLSVDVQGAFALACVLGKSIGALSEALELRKVF